MNVCKHPNNIESIETECKGKEKYNICYGEGEKYNNLNELDSYVSTLEKDITLNDEYTKIYTTGCWENKSNKPLLKDYTKLEEKDPIQCLTNGKKWITGDGYVINKKTNSRNLKNETTSKIDVECSPGYEGEPSIEVDGCTNYKSFKDGDEGVYQQFMLSGCNKCGIKYGGNRENKEDTSCYPQCGLMGTKIFDPSNSNKKLRFIDTVTDFTIGEKRAGYCCNDINNAVSIKRIKGTEKPEGSNYLDCSIIKCNEGYIKDYKEKYCCRKIENSKNDVEYSCGMDSENTTPLNKEINYCKDGFYPFINENGLYSCNPCEKNNSIHKDAEVVCDIDGTNTIIEMDSEYKCQEDGITYYDKNKNECVKCPHNMEINKDYDNELKGSNICICKSDYLFGDQCIQCLGENIKYNEEYPNNNDSLCKCVINKEYPLPENVLIGDCTEKTLYNGESCNLTCKPGYTLKGSQPRCLDNYFDKGTVTCTKSDLSSRGGEGSTEGFNNMFSITTNRLFLLLLLLILILNLC